MMKMLDVITRLDEAKQRVNNELKYLNEKFDQCKDIFCSVVLLKNKSRKRSQKQNKLKTSKIKNREKVKILNCFISFCQQT